MTVLRNSSFKVKASPVDTTEGLNIEAGAVVYDKSDGLVKMCDGVKWCVVLAEPYKDSYWVDLLGPATGANIDSASTRYAFDFFNGSVRFNADARNPEEVLAFEYQVLHEWKVGTNGKPHMHWKQRSADIPNWLVGYKIENNGEASVIETDYSGYTFGIIESHAFEYTSGVLNQISIFPDLDLSGANLSTLINIVLFRDTANVSGLFAGADPSALQEHVTDLDIHIEIDAPGSDLEYFK